MWIQILGDLGLSGYIASLHITTVILRTRVITGSRLWRKSNFQAWTLRTVHYCNDLKLELRLQLRQRLEKE